MMFKGYVFQFLTFKISHDTIRGWNVKFIKIPVSVLNNIRLGFGSKAYTSNNVGNKERKIEKEITSSSNKFNVRIK